MMDFLHESKKPLIDTLAHRSGAGIGERNDPNDRIGRDCPENVANTSVSFACANFLFDARMNKTRFARSLFGKDCHADCRDGCDYCRDPKQPSPMQRRDVPQSEKDETGKQRRTKSVNQKSP